MANFAIFANKNRYNMNKYLLCVDMFGPLRQRLESCDNLDEMLHVTVCLQNLNRIVTHDFIELYKAKLDELMKSGQLNSDSNSTIILGVFEISHFELINRFVNFLISFF